MFKMIFTSVTSMALTLGAVFIYLQYIENEPARSQPVITQDALATSAPATQTKRPTHRPVNTATASGTDVLRETPAVLANSNINTSTANKPAANADETGDDTTRELQKLIARVLAENGGTNYVAALDPETADTRTNIEKNADLFLNTVISNVAATTVPDTQTFTLSTRNYVDQLSELGTPPKRVTKAIKYKVKSGDSLAKISYLHYGRMDDYIVIFQANRDQLKDINHVKAGQTLIIPAH